VCKILLVTCDLHNIFFSNSYLIRLTVFRTDAVLHEAPHCAVSTASHLFIRNIFIYTSFKTVSFFVVVHVDELRIYEY
jgi:hypothetical protein